MTASSNPELVAAIRDQILHSPQQRISFADYMAAALYHPQHGYYSRGAKLGARGDFVTSSHLSADFGELLAEQLIEIWTVLGCPQHFDVVEMGAGQGILAVDILRFISQKKVGFFLKQLPILLLRSQPYCVSSNSKFKEPIYLGKPGTTLLMNLWRAVCFSNELVDAFPVHRLRRDQGQWQECYVSWDKGGRLSGGTWSPINPCLNSLF